MPKADIERQFSCVHFGPFSTNLLWPRDVRYATDSELPATWLPAWSGGAPVSRNEIKHQEWQTVTDGKSILRQRVEEIDGVSRAWFEWILEDSMMGKILVVEVEFDTDPSDPRFRQSVLDAIENTIMELSKNETTAIVGHLRIVPKGAA